MSGRRPRLLLAIAGLPAGGAERQMSLLARGLDRDRFEVGLLIFGRVERIHYPDIFDRPLWFRALEIPGDAPLPVVLAKLVRGIRSSVGEFAPALIHTSLNVANHAVRATALLCGWRMPIVTSIRTDFRRNYKASERRAERLLARRSARIVSNSDVTRRQLIEDLGIAPRRVVTIGNGIDPRFSPGPASLPPPPGWPAQWPADAPVGLVLGRFSPAKNQIGLLHALSELHAAGRLGDWRFLLVGEGPQEAEVRRLAESLGDRVAIAPPIADPLPLYRSAALTVIPSLIEGMPNVLLEAQASLCPVAATAAAVASGAMVEGNGWPLDVRSLAESLSAALSAPEAERRRRADAARADVLARFSAERMVAAHQEMFDDCLAETSRAG